MTDPPDGAPRPRTPRRAGAGVGPAITFALSAFLLFTGGSLWLMLYPPVPLDLGGVPSLDSAARHVALPMPGDQPLDLWALPGTKPAVVLLLHGYGRDHHREWRYAQFLRRAGYGVVTLDFRSSRSRDRKPTTMGAFEIEDADSALAWVTRSPDFAGARIGLFGESLGGSVALALAARHPQIEAVVVDCPFASARRALEDTFQYWLLLPGQVPAAFAVGLGRTLTGRDLATLDVMAAAESLRSRPIFFIHSLDDDRMRPAQVDDLWRAAGAKDSVWLADGGHNEAWMRHRAEYERRVLAFYGGTIGAPIAARQTPAAGAPAAPRPPATPHPPAAAGRRRS